MIEEAMSKETDDDVLFEMEKGLDFSRKSIRGRC